MLIVNINDDIQLLDFTIGFKLKYFQLNLRCLPNWNCLPITRMLKRLCNKSIFNFSGSENLLNNLTETILQDEYVALPPLIKVETKMHDFTDEIFQTREIVRRFDEVLIEKASR